MIRGAWEGFKAGVRWCVTTWPFGYLCDFEWGHQGRIRVTKDLWVIVGDKGGGTDALPITFCSPQLIARVEEELTGRWYAPTTKN
jgi:hypothetical protein